MKLVHLSFLAVILLNSICALPLAFYGIMQNSSSKMEYEEFDDLAETENLEYIQIYLETENGEEQDFIYTGEYNRIRIDLPDGIEAENIIMETTAGTLERTESDPTVFRILVKEENIDIEITAIEKNGRAEGYFYTQSVNFPLPQPGLLEEDNGNISIEKFKKQGQLILTNKTELPYLCKCNSFSVTRISKDNKRETVKNSGDAFSLELKALTAKAEAGDIFIFEDISVS